MEENFDKIELLEKENYTEIKINETKIKSISEYSIKKDRDIMEMNLKISIPSNNFTTIN